MPEVTEVRRAINLGRLEKYLESDLKRDSATRLGLPYHEFHGPFTAKQFKFGQSNPTYLITDSKKAQFVLRRKPSRNAKLVSKSAHAIEREFCLLRGIGILNKDEPRDDRKVPVPKVYVLCENEKVIGAVFYIMEYITGQQLHNPDMSEIESEEEKNKYWEGIMSTSAAIHHLDGEKLISHLPAKHFPQFQNIKKLKSTSYFKRQIRTLGGVHKSQLKTVDPIPNFDKICEWLAKNAPNDPSNLTLIHGDFKIDNILFNPRTKKVTAVLDWELCTFGNPLFDLSNFLQAFQIPNKLNRLFYQPQQTEVGFENPISSELVIEKLKLYYKLYEDDWNSKDLSNNPVNLNLVGYVFGLLRLCVISQGIATRVKAGVASSGNAEGFASLYPYLSELAIEGTKRYDASKVSKL